MTAPSQLESCPPRPPATSATTDANRSLTAPGPARRLRDLTTMSEGKRSSRLLRFAPLVVLAGIFLYVVARLPPGEPRYGGNPLHYWLVRARNESLPAAELANTRAAVICIGTNKLPLLLQWFREEEPPDHEPAYRKAINWLLSRQRFIRSRLEAAYRPSQPSMAFSVFNEYPEVAQTAIRSEERRVGKEC